MPPSQIAAYPRYFQVATSKFYFLMTAANPLSPTRTEIDAGLDFTRQVNGADGWGLKRDQIETRDFSSLFTKKIGGRSSVDDSSFTLYAAKTGIDARQQMPQDATGIIVIMWGGDTTGYKMDAFQVQVLSVAMMASDSDASMFQISYSITDQPALNIAVP